MNAIRLALAVLVLATAGTASAADAAQVSATVESPTRTITVNPLYIAFGALDVEFEQAIDARTTWFAGPRIGTAIIGYAGVTGGARFFLEGLAPEGTFLSPVASLSYGRDTVLWTLGGEVGHTWILDRRWVLSLGGGLQYASLQVGPYGFSGLAPELRFALGGAF
jgi:hypothetical protein